MTDCRNSSAIEIGQGDQRPDSIKCKGCHLLVKNLASPRSALRRIRDWTDVIGAPSLPMIRAQENLSMGCVMILCPVTGKPVSTGIDTELSTLEQAHPFVSRLACSACGQEHRWSRSDAWICDALPAAGGRAA
jgi:hypothetical protein